MPSLRVALAQVELTVGDFVGNATLIRDWVRQAVAAGADQLSGYALLLLTVYYYRKLADGRSHQNILFRVDIQLHQSPN